jgi:hypothetical protein
MQRLFKNAAIVLCLIVGAEANTAPKPDSAYGMAWDPSGERYAAKKEPPPKPESKWDPTGAKYMPKKPVPRTVETKPEPMHAPMPDLTAEPELATPAWALAEAHARAHNAAHGQAHWQDHIARQVAFARAPLPERKLLNRGQSPIRGE